MDIIIAIIGCIILSPFIVGILMGVGVIAGNIIGFTYFLCVSVCKGIKWCFSGNFKTGVKALQLKQSAL